MAEAVLRAPRAAALFEGAKPFSTLKMDAAAPALAQRAPVPAEPPAPAAEPPAPVVDAAANPAPANEAPVVDAAAKAQAVLPEPEAVEEAPKPLDPERRVLAGDAAFHADRRKGLVVLGVGLWLALAVGALVAFALAPMDLRGLAVAVGVGFATYAVTAIITGLLLDRALERKLNEIRRIARIGCERVRVDDVALVRPALRDVLSEWLHIQFFIRRHRETNYWFMWGYGVQSAITLLALLVLPWSMLIEDQTIRFGLLGAAVFLTVAHGVWEVLRLAGQRKALIFEDQSDPTDVIADRMEGLLSEVKELRKHGRHAD